MYIEQKMTKGMLKYIYVTIHVKCTVNCKMFKIYVTMFGLQ